MTHSKAWSILAVRLTIFVIYWLSHIRMVEPFCQFQIQHLPVRLALGSGCLHLTRQKCPVIQTLQGRGMAIFMLQGMQCAFTNTPVLWQWEPGCRIVCCTWCTDETSVYGRCFYKSAGVLTIGITSKKTLKQTWTEIDCPESWTDFMNAMFHTILTSKFTKHHKTNLSCIFFTPWIIHLWNFEIPLVLNFVDEQPSAYVGSGSFYQFLQFIH